MSAVVKVVPRRREVQAMRVLLGITTKDEILKFCPKANVGYANNNIKDIRWVLVPHNGTLIDEMQHDGDWIIEVATGHWVIKSDTEFHREYVIA